MKPGCDDDGEVWLYCTLQAAVAATTGRQALGIVSAAGYNTRERVVRRYSGREGTSTK